MGSTRWGHDAKCCSDACGKAYSGSVKEAEAELARARDALAEAQRSVDRWSHSLMCRQRNPLLRCTPAESDTKPAADPDRT